MADNSNSTNPLEWIFSGIGVVILTSLVTFIFRYFLRLRPFRNLNVLPIPELSNIPDLSDRPDQFLSFGLRIINQHGSPIHIELISCSSQRALTGEWCFPTTKFADQNGNDIRFPFILNGHSTHDLIVTTPLLNPQAGNLELRFGLQRNDTVRQPVLILEIFRDQDEMQLFGNWGRREFMFGSMRIPKGVSGMDVKFRRRLRKAPKFIQTKMEKTSDKAL